MKKILLFLTLFLISNEVHALTYYSDYYENSEWTTNKIEETDTVKVKEEKRYLWYKEERIDGTYTEDINYPYIDYDNFIEEEVCNLEYSDNKKEQTTYYYKELLPIRYIHFGELSGSYGSFRISELQIIYDGNDLDYQVVKCDGCNSTFLEYIHNGKFKENMSSLSNGGSFTIDLGNYYYLNELDINIAIYDAGPQEEYFSIYLTRNENLNRIYYAQHMLTYYNYSAASETNMQQIVKEGFYEIDPEYSEEIESLEEIKETDTIKVRVEKKYCSLEKKYLHYNLERHYLDEYQTIGTEEYPNKDIESELTFYQSMNRDYLIIPDNIVITNKGDDITSMIKSNLPFEVTSDINLDENGVYQFEVNSPVKKVISTVTLDLEENRKRKELENTIEEQKKQIIKTTEQLESLLLEIDSLKDLNQYLENQNKLIEADKLEQNTNYLKEIEQLNNRITNKTEVCENIEIEKSSVINFQPYIGIILVISGVILSALIILKKNN